MLHNLMSGFVLLQLLLATNGFIVDVDANEIVCFFDNTENDDKVSIHFEVMEGGFKDIALTITGPNNETFYNVERDSVGAFTFTSNGRGKFTMCFDNSMSTVTPKVIMFQLVVLHALDYYVHPQQRSDDVIEHSLVQAMTNELSHKMNYVKQEQEYMHVRYKGHLEISKSVHFRIVVWSIFAPSLLLVLTISEVYYLKRFFECKRVV